MLLNVLIDTYVNIVLTFENKRVNENNVLTS